MGRILRENALSITMFGIFLAILVGQALVGRTEYNQEQLQHGQMAVAMGEYLRSAHFLEAVAENWESEFFQMAAFVWLTSKLIQKGSPESRTPGDNDDYPRKLPPDAPWPVRRGGLVLKLYENSLTLGFVVLFIAAFIFHVVSGVAEYNEEQLEHGQATVGTLAFLGTARFWFQAFQNWQSEFLAAGAMVVLSIFLRQRGSPESKPVYAPHSATGSEGEELKEALEEEDEGEQPAPADPPSHRLPGAHGGLVHP